MFFPTHWTPRYALNRFSQLTDRLVHPETPWLTRHANLILASYLRRSDVGFEFGSGRSTLWFANRVSELTSVEHDRTWFSRISKAIAESGLRNVHYILAGHERGALEGPESEYVHALQNKPAESLDFILVDGILRDECAIESLRRIRPGGLLIVDNSNWFLPSDSIAPGSRSLQAGPASPRWGQFMILSAKWRQLRTTDGVTETTFFTKPCSADSVPPGRQVTVGGAEEIGQERVRKVS